MWHLARKCPENDPDHWDDWKGKDEGAVPLGLRYSITLGRQSLALPIPLLISPCATLSFGHPTMLIRQCVMSQYFMSVAK